MFATATGSSRCCTSCAARSSRCRAISESAKLGRSTTSASKSSPASSRRLGTWIEALAPSKVAVVPSWAPRNAASSATSKALRAPAPCCSIVAVKVASPGTPDGSRAAPASGAREAWCDRPPGQTRGKSVTRSATASARPASASWRRPFFHRELRLSLGHHTEHHTVRTGQIRLRGALDRRRRHPAIAVEVLLEVVGSPDEVVVIVQLIGLAAEAAHALHPRQELRLEGVLGPLHLPRRRTLVGELLQLLVDHPLQLAEVVAGAGGGIDLEFTVDATAILERHHVRRDLQLVHQPSIEA